MIYPKLQHNSLNGETIKISSVKIVGEFKEIAEKLFKAHNISTNGNYTVEILISNTKRTTYIDSLSRLSDEKYFITATDDKTVIEASARRGAFRAINTLIKLISNNSLRVGTVEDYPLFEKRGYIEGFYGNTWERNKRLSVINLMAHNGMNTFYYAPKDDIYHREKWRELYPQNELNELKELFNAATENELDFHWCIGPGLTYHYTDESDFNTLIAKIRSIYDIGIKNFGLLLDDIPSEFQYSDDGECFDSIVDAHINLINRTYQALKAIDSNIHLTVCPTEYCGDENSYYVTKFGQNIPGDVSIFWTGKEICSRVLTTNEAGDFLRSTNHRPLYWDNYPVNDAEMFQEMHLGPIIGRDADLYKNCEGLISNVMEYAECSKIPLLTIADYLWNPIAYKPEESLKNAQKQILGEKAELFGYIADHLAVSCLCRHASVEMSDKLSHLGFLFSTGRKEEALNQLAEYIGELKKCLDMLNDTSIPLFDEIQKWTKKFELCCEVLDCIYNVYNSPSVKNKANLAQKLNQYNSDAVILTGFCLRETAEKALML